MLKTWLFRKFQRKFATTCLCGEITDNYFFREILVLPSSTVAISCSKEVVYSLTNSVQKANQHLFFWLLNLCRKQHSGAQRISTPGPVREWYFRLVIVFPTEVEKFYLTIDGRTIYFGSEDTNRYPIAQTCSHIIVLFISLCPKLIFVLDNHISTSRYCT